MHTYTSDKKKSKQCSKVVDFLLHEGCSAFSPSVGSEASDITVGPGNPQMKEKGKGSACMHVPAFFLIPASKVPPRQSLLPAFSASLSALVSAKHPAQCRARRRRGELVARAPASTFPPQRVTNSLWSLSQVVRSKGSRLLGECSCARRVATLLHAMKPCVATSATPPLLIPHRRLLPPLSWALSGLSSRQMCGPAPPAPLPPVSWAARGALGWEDAWPGVSRRLALDQQPARAVAELVAGEPGGCRRVRATMRATRPSQVGRRVAAGVEQQGCPSN